MHWAKSRQTSKNLSYLVVGLLHYKTCHIQLWAFNIIKLVCYNHSNFLVFRQLIKLLFATIEDPICQLQRFNLQNKYARLESSCNRDISLNLIFCPQISPTDLLQFVQNIYTWYKKWNTVQLFMMSLDFSNIKCTIILG